jgi:large subunit ribosomal protein L33
MTTKGGFLMREKIILICTECLSRNYTTTKNKQTQKERIEYVKYCSRCNKHTVHKESK